MNGFRFLTFFVILVTPLASVLAQNCGRQGGNAPCSSGNCCSQYGYCGNTATYCSPQNNCQSQCSGSSTPSTGDVDTIVTATLFDQMLKYRNDPRCKGNGFYTYNAFINAARTYNGFGTTGSSDDRKRELAAFLAQTSKKQQVDGQLHQMVNSHGDIALLEKQTRQAGTVTPLTGPVPKATMAEDQYNSHTTTTMGCLEGQLIGI